MPDLVKKLRELVVCHFKDLKRAMFGEGRYKLCPEFSRFKISTTGFSNLSDGSQDRWFQKFLKTGKFPKPMSVSIDGTLAVPYSPTGGQKLGQRKRKRPCKSTSVTSRSRPQIENTQ